MPTLEPTLKYGRESVIGIGISIDIPIGYLHQCFRYLLRYFEIHVSNLRLESLF